MTCREGHRPSEPLKQPFNPSPWPDLCRGLEIHSNGFLEMECHLYSGWVMREVRRRRRVILDGGEAPSAIQIHLRAASFLSFNMRRLRAVLNTERARLQENQALQTDSHHTLARFSWSKRRFLCQAQPPFNNAFLTWPVENESPRVYFLGKWVETPDPESCPPDHNLTSTY